MTRLRRLNSLLVINFVLMVILLHTFISCTVKNDDKLENSVYWRVTPSGLILTNDLKRLQNEVPFDIILPEYLPENQRGHPPDFQYSLGDNSYKDINITALFATTESPKFIFIEEFNSQSPIDFLTPNYSARHKFLEFGEEKVLEQSGTAPISLGSQIVQPYFDYRWVINNVYYSVDVEGYDRDEALKIVESMIKQIE